MEKVTIKRRVRTHRDIRTMRSLFTHTGPGRGNWLRLQESEQLADVWARCCRRPMARARHGAPASQGQGEPPAEE